MRAIVVFGLHRPDGYLCSDMGGYVGRATEVANGVHNQVLALFSPGAPSPPVARQDLLAAALTAQDHLRFVRHLEDPDLATT